MTIVDTAARVQELRVRLGLGRPVAPASAATFQFTLDGVSTAAPSHATAAAPVVAAAEKYLGVPYVFGGTDPDTGLDCSGLVQRAYADVGVKLPRLAKDQARVGTAVTSLAEARPGDLVAFHSPVDHIGIYVGDGKMIVSPHTGDKVKIQPVPGTPSAIRRVLPDPVPVAAAVRPAALSSSVPYADLFRAAGAKYGVSPALLAAVAKVESNYNAGAVSKAGARGLMQIMPSTAAGLGIDPNDPAQAVDGAARILAKNLKDFGSVPLALAAYNAGGGAVRKYGGIPPYAQTQAYVPKVQAALAALNDRGFS